MLKKIFTVTLRDIKRCHYKKNTKISLTKYCYLKFSVQKTARDLFKEVLRVHHAGRHCTPLLI